MTEVRYRAVPGLRTLDFADEWVVFNDATWETHVLNAAAAGVLAALAESPAGGDDVAAHLAQWLGADDVADAQAHAVRLLDELATLGLVHPEPAA